MLPPRSNASLTAAPTRERAFGLALFFAYRNLRFGAVPANIQSPMKVEEDLALSAPAVAAPVAGWLKVEGLAVATLSAVLYARTGASWWVFAALWLTPDLAMLAYFAGARWGAHGYNAVHSYLLPVVLVLVALAGQQTALLPFALIWFNHIGVDRLLGYGLKYPDGFGFTHLSRKRSVRRN